VGRQGCGIACLNGPCPALQSKSQVTASLPAGIARPGQAPARPACPLPATSPCPSLADIQKATQQLQAQADILLLALALSNAAVLQHGPPHVLGTVEVAEGPVSQDAKRHWQHQQLTVGSRGPAPKVVMQLRIKG